MRKKLNSKVFCTLLLIMVMLSDCKNKPSGHKHPSEHIHSASDTVLQTISPNKQVLSKQTTLTPQYGSTGAIMKAQGFISPDQSRNQSVAVRFSGRVDKLYVKFNNQLVKQGDKIMDIYSPDLRTYQEEHLFLFKSNNENTLLKKSREKLRLLGITDNQIAQLEIKGSVALTISVFSPASGYVFFNTETPQENSTANNTSAMNVMGMQQNTNNENTTAASASQIREGMYVNAGQTLFSVNDLQKVWALVSVSNQYLNQLHENQSVVVISENNPSKTLNGKVELIEPTFKDAGQRFARIRIVLPNPNYSLKINSLITAEFSSNNNKILQVPASAVYKTGLNAYVWIKTDTTKKGTGIFQLRKIIAGISNNGMITIMSGLSSQEEIAKEAGLMTDSETYLNAN